MLSVPLYYIGWQWVDAKMKLQALNQDSSNSYVRARMRIVKGVKSGDSFQASGEIQARENGPSTPLPH